MTSKRHYEDGCKLYARGDYQNALIKYQKSHELEPSNDCLNYIGCCYLELNDFKSASEIFWKLSDDNPTWERPAFNLGRTFLKSGYMDEALTCFKEAERRNHESEDVYYYLGVYYSTIQDFEKAVRYYEKSLSLNNEQPETHLNLGICYSNLDMHEKAIEEFEAAYKYNNECIDAIRNKAVSLMLMKDYEKSLSVLFEALGKKIDDVELIMDIAHCYYKLNDFDNAKDWADKVLSLEPEHKMANKLFKRLKS